MSSLDLMTSEVSQRLGHFPFNSQKGKAEKTVIVRYFSPYHLNKTWEVVEAEYDNQSGTWMFYGLVKDKEGSKMEYFTLRDLRRLVFSRDIPLQLVERDTFWYYYKITEDGKVVSGI